MSFDQKIADIKRRTSALEQKVGGFAQSFYKTLIDQLIDGLEVSGGKIVNNANNLGLIAKIDQLYSKFTAATVAPEIVKDITTGKDAIAKFNTDYFSQFGSGSQYEQSRESVQKNINDRLGIGDKTSLKKGGYMDSMLKDVSVANQIKNFAIQEVVKQTGFKDFKAGLGKMIVGDKTRLGAFEQYYRNYAYDIFVNVDRTESMLMAKELNLTYFVYGGTIIDTSRAFCIKRAGNVYTAEEAAKWKDDPWIKNAFEKGYISSYDPINDMGLFGCRHSPQFISKEAAELLRPDLKTGPTKPKEPPKKEDKPKPEPKPKAAPKPKAEPTPPPQVDPKKFVPAKTVPESVKNLESSIREASGLNIQSGGKIDPSLSVEEFNRRAKVVADLFNEYDTTPLVDKSKPTKITFKSEGGFFGVVRRMYGSKGANMFEVNFGHTTGRDSDRTFKPYSEGNEVMSRGKSVVDPENISIATTVHEFAHVIETRHDIQWNRSSRKNNSEFYDKLKSIRMKYNKELKLLYKTKRLSEINDIFLGNYANTNSDEFFAEAWTDYKLRKSPSKYGKLVGELVDKYWKRK